jgi:Flp pilus assembly protein TadG
VNRGILRARATAIGPRASLASSSSSLAFPRTPARRGAAIVWVALILIILIAFASFAVDLGRVRVGKAQLQTAADAAARAGVSALPNGPSSEAEDRAVEVANANECMGTSVELVVEEDIVLGLWNEVDRTFSELTDDPGTLIDERRGANACKVTTRRTVDRGNAMPLTLARVLGKTTFNAEAAAIAYIKGRKRGFGLIGLDWIRMTGTTMTDSYNAATETYPGADGPNNNGTIASNGNITLNGTVDVHGDAYPGYPNHIVDKTSNVTVTGDWHTPLDEPLVYPAETMPTTGTNLGNVDLKNQQTLTLNGSNDPSNPTIYRASGFRLRGGSELFINGYVKLYVSGNVDMAGNTTMNGAPALPARLEISVTSANTSVDVSGTSELSAHIYAPLSNVRLNGTPGFYGWVIGKTLEMVGNSEIHYDESFPMVTGPYTITLVK